MWRAAAPLHGEETRRKVLKVQNGDMETQETSGRLRFRAVRLYLGLCICTNRPSVCVCVCVSQLETLTSHLNLSYYGMNKALL